VRRLALELEPTAFQGDKGRFLRAMALLAERDAAPSFAKAARISGIPNGSISTWLHRDPALRAAAEQLKGSH
jgi:hypothetical protein